mmetsp:Transcript_22956/g.45883  ORF Transcript_22956/g.45883 Transcript_22956/m.45883 type:complete len:244 (+) Transcript_22956:1007-1738(+)
MHQILAHQVHIVLHDRTDRNDGRAVRHRPHDELPDLFLLREGRVHLDQVDLILQDDDVLQAHDFDGGEVFGRLGLRAGFVAGNEEEGAVHDGRAVEHGGHEDVVAGAVDEGDVAAEGVGDAVFGEGVGVGGAAGGVHRVGGAGDDGGGGVVVGVGFLLVVGEGRQGGGLVDLGVGVAQLDGDVAFQFVLEADGLDAGDGFHDGGFSVGDVADGSDVDGGLARDHFGSEGRQFGGIDGAGILGH